MITDQQLMARAILYVCEENNLTVESIKQLDGYRQRALQDYAVAIADDMRYNQLKYFRALPYQLEFFKTGAISDRRGILAANRVGKSIATCYELAYHLTGRYPDWWAGKRFAKPISAYCAGESWTPVAEVLQEKLLGSPDVKITHLLGTAAVPKECIVFDTIRSDGPNIISCEVKHITGGISRLRFGNYTQEVRNLQGFEMDLVLLDEQPPDDFFSEIVTRTATTQGMFICSFTPLKGLNGLVSKFWNREVGYEYVRVSWDDVPEYDLWNQPLLLKSTREQLERDFMPWERDARISGVPVMGVGAVFPLKQWNTYRNGEIDFKANPNMRRIIALDLGLINDATVISLAYWDSYERNFYLHSQIIVGGRENKRRVAAGEMAIQEGNPLNYINHLTRPEVFGCPIVLPADAGTSGRYTMSALSIRELFEEYNLNVYHKAIMNPPDPEGKVTNHKSFGINVMRQMLEMGSFRINENCVAFLDEAKNYFVDEKGRYSDPDDTIDSARYALLGCLNDICEPLDNSIKTKKYDHYRDLLNRSNEQKPAWKQVFNPENPY